MVQLGEFMAQIILIHNTKTAGVLANESRCVLYNVNHGAACNSPPKVLVSREIIS